ncbi:MFS transporter [Nocardioides dubius]|uniref:Major facilitator superfamily (MFS) profile domain-containing protein n=1 Tax=Nocardioides dubius TaxID=317019 RepID=A0ABN1TQD0_9ACTN
MTATTPHSDVHAPPAPPVRAGAIVFVLAFAGITAALMQTLVVPLLLELPDLLDTTTSNAAWVVTVTLLTAGVATPVSGRLGDLYGKRRVMLVCASVLVVGSLICALSSTVVPMIVGRGLQGVGMGIVPLGISALKELLPPEKLGSSIALMSASMGVGGALGLPVAAAVAEHSDWHTLFWGATGLAVIVTVLIATLVPATPAQAKGKFDPIGAIGLGAGLVCLLLGVSKGADWGWSDPLTLACLIAAPILFVAWGFWELRVSDPLVDLRVTARPVVLLTNAAALVVGFAMYAQSLILPQLLQMPEETGYGLGQSMLAMGLWMLPGGFMMMLVSPLGAKLSAARNPKVTLTLGAAIVAVGYLMAAMLMGHTWGITLSVMVISSGIGFAYGAMPALIMGSVPMSEIGSANSFNTLMRSVGTSIAGAVVGVVLAQMTHDYGGYELTSETGFRTGLLIGAGVALVAALVAATIPTKAAIEAAEHIEHPA